jgi:hypothetical protein
MDNCLIHYNPQFFFHYYKASELTIFETNFILQMCLELLLFNSLRVKI